MSLGKTDKRMYAIMSACNEIFAWNYPESMHKIIIINAPMAFQVTRRSDAVAPRT